MKAKDLAKKLMEYPDADVTVSVDVGTEEIPYRRVFGNSLSSVQKESDDSLTILFDEGYDNHDVGEL